jgi:hypothetical protein
MGDTGEGVDMVWVWLAVYPNTPNMPSFTEVRDRDIM